MKYDNGKIFAARNNWLVEMYENDKSYFDIWDLKHEVKRDLRKAYDNIVEYTAKFDDTLNIIKVFEGK
jgi:hypothetical protein